MKKYDWSKERVEEAIANSLNYCDVLRYLNIPLSGNNSGTLKRKIKEYDLDVSHFTLKGRKGRVRYINAEYYLKKGSNIKSAKLKNKLLQEGIKENKCEICGLTEWLGRPLTIQLHHIDGDDTNNEISNLQMLCPNCHSQTDNYRGNANKEKHLCPDCGTEISGRALHCRKCSLKYQNRTRKLNITDDELLEEKRVLKTNMAIARKYNVSDSYISRRFRLISVSRGPNPRGTTT